MKLTKKQIERYEVLISHNAPGEAYEQIASDVGQIRFMNLFKNINQIHTIEGYLSYDIHAVRNRIKEEFKEYLQQSLTKESYENLARFI
ncbi:hypothetical protein [Paenibacillus gallinarum]|uniref:Uncharacterized protein n=1 Tax=Paenibacillus gallinarum TaxID=2762232 RepID=A0ABR8T3D5_9BACL|nr:hypothetical protein [Paenibacillus gallinarum]MBD7970266.1 hypothetical protein [Paenibacillus gallinarum]